jgi:hypothetical protein
MKWIFRSALAVAKRNPKQANKNVRAPIGCGFFFACRCVSSGWRISWRGLVAACCLAASSGFVAERSAAAASPAPKSSQPARFLPTSKPLTRWWWFASQIQEADVDAQLDWLKANHFGGVEIAWMYPLTIERYQRFYPWITDEQRQQPTPRQEWLSPEWSRIVGYTKRSAERRGLQCDFTFGSAWPFGDSQVPEADAGKVFDDPRFRQLNLIPWEYPKQGFILDHLSQPAFDRYAQRMGAALGEGLRGARSGLFCDSWEVESNRIWTDGLGEEFKTRFGYAIEPFMPTIFEGPDADARYDYLKLISDRVIANFYRPYAAKCRELGAFSRVQCGGAPADLLAAFAEIDVPETEALLYEPVFARIPASAAALAGKAELSSETFTCLYGFPREHIRDAQCADLKLLADALFAHGVNHIVWHGKPFNPRGSDRVEFYAAVHVGPTSAFAPELLAFNRYLETVSAAMKQGRVYSQVAQYLPTEDAWMAGVYPAEKRFKWAWGAYEMRHVRPAAELKGYQPLWINQGFLRQARFANGHLLAGDLSFSALYVTVEHLDAELLGVILGLARQGLPVCLKQQPVQAGRVKSEAFARDLAALNALPSVSPDFARVAPGKPLMEGEELPDFWCRVDGDRYRIFFANPLTKGVTYPLRYGQSFAEHDLQVPVKINMDSASVATTLVFKPYQSLLVEVDSRGKLRRQDIEFKPKPPRSAVTDQTSETPGQKGKGS